MFVFKQENVFDFAFYSDIEYSRDYTMWFVVTQQVTYRLQALIL
jgi:hypothetical protein